MEGLTEFRMYHHTIISDTLSVLDVLVFNFYSDKTPLNDKSETHVGLSLNITCVTVIEQIFYVVFT